MKKCIISFILGAIIFTGVTVLAETKINADKVSYSDTETVKDKIDDLYTDINSKNLTFDTENAKYEMDSGSILTTRSTSINLTKGKYLVTRASETAWSSRTVDNYANSITPNHLNCSSNNCVITPIDGYTYRQNTDSEIKSGYKNTLLSGVQLYFVEIKEDNDIVKTSATFVQNLDTGVQSIQLHALPISY